jgi:NADPH:quinone reductase-like Zn-dependent oxidoreductase
MTSETRVGANGKTMRALVMHRHGGSDVLTLEERWPRPEPRAGEILVRVNTCALNYLDIFVREGMPGEPTPLPHITGGDIAGVVEAVGPGVTLPAVGQRVVLDPAWGCGRCEYCRGGDTPLCLRPRMLGELDPGGLAEFVTCPAEQAIPVPDRYGLDEAACLPVAFGTAWRMVVTKGRTTPGDIVVVLGAAGGVGLAAVQIAKLAGGRIIATASTDAKLTRLRDLGADEVINYARDEDWDVTVRGLTGKRGADVIIETVGASTWERSIRALGKNGRLVTSGATSGPIGPTDIRYLFRREHAILGANGWTHDELRKVAGLAFAGRLKPVIDRRLPLERAGEGQEAMARREVFGKVIVYP